MLVSKQHFRIYSILFDDMEKSHQPPLIYCEDLESRNGTYVNNSLIGMLNKPMGAYLLSDGDTIRIPPFWSLTFKQSIFTGLGCFNEIQEAEQEARIIQIGAFSSADEHSIFGTATLLAHGCLAVEVLVLSTLPTTPC